MNSLLLLAACVTQAASAQADNAVLLREAFPPGYQVHVSCRVEIDGTLSLPGNKVSPSLSVNGRSKIDYDERILPPTKPGTVDRTLRHYERLLFTRKVGDEDQQNSLRPEASRLVVLRHRPYEVPFCPTGPLTWGEIDLVRTDVFTPALAGLLPTDAVKPGARWQAGEEAVMELTDLEALTSGRLTCDFKGIIHVGGRPQAHIGVVGQVRGIGEDGSASHTLDGTLYFDLDGRYLSYLHVRGTHTLLDKTGQPIGKIDGSCTLTRNPIANTAQLGDAALRGLTLEPNDDNTLLLYEDARLGVRFLYPRNWRVAGTTGKQIGIDEKRGGGLLITVEPAYATPSAAQYLQTVRGVLDKREKATIVYVDRPRTLEPGVEAFTIDAWVAQKRVTLPYFVVRQADGGATIDGNLPGTATTTARREAERIVRSLQLTRPR